MRQTANMHYVSLSGLVHLFPLVPLTLQKDDLMQIEIASVCSWGRLTNLNTPEMKHSLCVHYSLSATTVSTFTDGCYNHGVWGKCGLIQINLSIILGNYSYCKRVSNTLAL